MIKYDEQTRTISKDGRVGAVDEVQVDKVIGECMILRDHFRNSYIATKEGIFITDLENKVDHIEASKFLEEVFLGKDADYDRKYIEDCIIKTIAKAPQIMQYIPVGIYNSLSQFPARISLAHQEHILGMVAKAKGSEIETIYNKAAKEVADIKAFVKSLEEGKAKIDALFLDDENSAN